MGAFSYRRYGVALRAGNLCCVNLWHFPYAVCIKPDACGSDGRHFGNQYFAGGADDFFRIQFYHFENGSYRGVLVAGFPGFFAFDCQAGGNYEPEAGRVL